MPSKPMQVRADGTAQSVTPARWRQCQRLRIVAQSIGVVNGLPQKGRVHQRAHRRWGVVRLMLLIFVYMCLPSVDTIRRIQQAAPERIRIPYKLYIPYTLLLI